MALERILVGLALFGFFVISLHLAFRAIDIQVCNSRDVITANELGCFKDGILK